MNDPGLFPSPEKFIPERFLPTSELFNPKLHPFDLPFGFGRRICPGMHFARNSLFINLARILWAFEILPETNKEGVPFIPDSRNYTNGFNSRPVSFPCQFVARNADIANLVGKEGETALQTLRKLM